MADSSYPVSDLRWQMREDDLVNMTGPDRLLIKATEDLHVPKGTYLDKTYFIGVNLLHCRSGRFRFSFAHDSSVTLQAGELLVLFPRQFVTIEALEAQADNHLSYTIVSGCLVEEYFWRLGFFNGFHAPCAFQEAAFRRLQAILEENSGPEDTKHTERLLCLFNQIVRTAIEDIRQDADRIFLDAVRQVNLNALAGLYHVKPLCAQLGLSRSQVHRIFVRNGVESVGQFVRNMQVQYATKLLLSDKNLTLSDIAKKTGFASQANFSSFIRLHTGLTPLQIRGRKILAK